MLSEEAARWALALAVGGLALGAIGGLIWPAPRRAVAVRADRVLGLKERVSTALELHGLAGGNELAVAQVRDAVQRADAVARIPRLGPTVDRRFAFAVGGLTILVAAALWLPNLQDDTVRERRADAEQVEAAREQVEAVSAEVAVRTDLDPAAREAMLARLDALTETLDPGALSGEEAQAELAAAEGDLHRLEDAAAPQQAQALREAAPTLQTSGATADVGNALAQGDMAAAAEAMDQLAEQVDDLSPEEQQALANRLNELAAQVQATNPELAASLAAAAASLAGGDPAAASASLSQASAELSQLASALATNDAAGQASASLSETRASLASGNLTGNQSDAAQSGQSSNGASGSGTPSAGPAGSSGSSGSQSATPGAGQSSGQSGSGQSGTQGQGQGQGAGSVSGNGQVAGSNARTTTGGNASGNAQPQQGEAGTEGTREEEPVYAPASQSGQTGNEDFLPGQEGPGNSETGVQTGTGVATDATVPYSTVYGEYAQQAGRDLEQGAVPAPLQPYVRDYFSSLEPVADDEDEES
jgi:hypothetical protein